MITSIAPEAITFETQHEAGGTYILIPVECSGQSLRILLDTGIKDLMLFKGRLRGTLQHLQSRAQEVNLNPGGQDRLTEVELETVRTGALSREKQKAYVWTTPEDHLRNIDGSLARPHSDCLDPIRLQPAYSLARVSHKGPEPRPPLQRIGFAIGQGARVDSRRQISDRYRSISTVPSISAAKCCYHDSAASNRGKFITFEGLDGCGKSTQTR